MARATSAAHHRHTIINVTTFSSPLLTSSSQSGLPFSPSLCVYTFSPLSLLHHLPISLRLSGDVQELKSSFKLVVGQGLRSTTQVLGCVFSLFLISPQMTVLMGVALPVMVAMGTVLGSILRRWSRQSQEQMAIATGVADEAIGNIQTVRAFAMEDYENK